MPLLKPKTVLYRNYDHEFEKQLDRPSSERKIAVGMEFADNAFGFTLSLTDENAHRAMVTRPFEKEEARREQYDNIHTQLAKLGNTIFEAIDIQVHMERNWFVPSSVLADMRREAVEALESVRKIAYRREPAREVKPVSDSVIPSGLTYLANVSNVKAREFYLEKGVKEIAPAFELQPSLDVPLMFTKHCLRYSMGWCPVYQKEKSPYKEPYYIAYKDTRLRLVFDCKNCQMLIYKDL